MKVQSSTVDLYGDFKLEQRHTVQERMKTWVDKQSTDAGPSTESLTDSLSLSADVLSNLKLEAQKTSGAAKSQETSYELSAKDRELIALLERFLSNLTGKTVKINIPGKLILGNPNNVALNVQNGTNQRQGWGLDYHYEESYAEQETMNFSAQGKVYTDDGREIEINLNLEVSRQFNFSQSLDIKAGDALIDPLVINYGGGTATLSPTKTDFDLDGDGEKENISNLEQGSGFLALDKNSDGVINDGQELFGPQTGDGFSELAGYDADKNGWIDENDPVFKKLSIRAKDSGGNDQLLALAQTGIGAIYIGNADTLFSLKDSENNLNGQIRQTGIFLKEDGQAGTIQHVDLAV